MSERNEIARLVWSSAIHDAADAEDAALILIAANIRHLPSLADDPEAVDRVARWIATTFGDPGQYAGQLEARDLLRALAGGES